MKLWKRPGWVRSCNWATGIAAAQPGTPSSFVCTHAGKSGAAGTAMQKVAPLEAVALPAAAPPPQPAPPSPASRSAFESPRRRDGRIRPARRSRLKALDMAGRGGGRGAAEVASRWKELRPGQTSPAPPPPRGRGLPRPFHYVPRNVSPEVREIVRMCEIRHRRAALPHDRFKYLTR